MRSVLILYPAIAMMLLTIFLYVKNYFDNRRARKSNSIKFSYFKTYEGKVPEYMAISRQTLKNQFELPIFFYFLVSIIISFDQVLLIDIVLGWLFVLLRYIHCFIRLSSNYILYRAISFQFGMFILFIWWIVFLYNII